ncbi:BQ5605_C018g08687 [Microbotryum silenes-dioicae]|uniref:BQ5605_C018g08687 protein n=1 Tax=Microbotryum silenes-dioicae TaxID=796604 RepID=A0A2X0M1B6_9BASI|nr:BQ5605_C018g08687 [Microbotryum silenes-dioicae]
MDEMCGARPKMIAYGSTGDSGGESGTHSLGTVRDFSRLSGGGIGSRTEGNGTAAQGLWSAGAAEVGLTLRLLGARVFERREEPSNVSVHWSLRSSRTSSAMDVPGRLKVKDPFGARWRLATNGFRTNREVDVAGGRYGLEGDDGSQRVEHAKAILSSVSKTQGLADDWFNGLLRPR